MTGAFAIEVFNDAAGTASGKAVVLRAAAIDGVSGRRSALRVKGRVARAFWNELYLEFRRQAGDERLPASLRGALRRLASRTFGRASHDPDARLPRQLLRRQLSVRLSEEGERLAGQQAADAGIDLDTSLVAIEMRNRPDLFSAVVDRLTARGLTVVRIGGGAPDRLPMAGVIDLVASGRTTPLLELSLVRRAQFVVCGGADLQQLSYLFDTPSLTLNGLDPFRLYPVRANGIYLLRTALDVRTGRIMPPDEQLSDLYFRNWRELAWREHAPADISAGVDEMLEGVDRGWRDTPSQTTYRDAVLAAGAQMAGAVRYVREHGPDHGFIGDGRLARVQAERMP